MIRSFLTVSSGTLASRLLGFVRDSLLAALLGAGAVADAFLAAFQLVNVVRRLLTEGGLNAALVPAWLRVRETEGAVGARRRLPAACSARSRAALIAATALLGAGDAAVITWRWRRGISLQLAPDPGARRCSSPPTMRG